MIKSLRGRLIISYVLIAALSIALISILSNKLLEKQFNDYVIKAQQQESEDIQRSIRDQYAADKKWNMSVLERVGVDALENGFIIKVTDASGNMLWDATEHNNGKCEAIIKHYAENMMSRYPHWTGGYVQNNYPINVDNATVGTVNIGYYGPFYYTDHDLIFLGTLNKIFMSVAAFSLLLAVIAGVMMAHGLSRPIAKVIKSAQAITGGNYRSRITEKSSTAEMKMLIHAINDMAYSLESQELLRKRLTADVAHELRTPLATLQSHMEAMIDGVWEPTADRIKSCHEEVVRINRLVGGLEKLAQYESENLNITKSSFDLGELIRGILLNFEIQFLNKNIEVSYNCKPAPIKADKDKLSQVIINLLSNALKYTPEGGKVEIGIKQNNGTSLFCVKDSGIGISEEDLPYIFERFYRVDKSRSRATGGSGIGLTITKSIVEAHGGTITVKSQLGQGSTFYVALPAN
ncbi:MAG: ATP-binding protein [Bacillota bacterium]|nr:ATP-binding protein [Bacillota bacterium]